jgi:ClpP class serine protease
LCLAPDALGRAFRVHAQRPDARTNKRIERADLPSGASHAITAVAPASLIRVEIVGPVEQRSGFHDVCGGWSDGHDAISERLCAAFEEGDVLLVIDSPGGAAAGLEQGLDRALKKKTKRDRRVTVWANEQIGSALTWWAFALGDEIFLPKRGAIGSIGARAGHLSIAGALAKDGMVPSFFTWPNDGKIAFAPELPLSEIGKARGERDVALVGEAFCAAVISSPIGQRNKLTREAIIALGADMLTGVAAVDAGLADGVATEDEVLAYALKLAEKSSNRTSAHARARGDRPMRTNSGAHLRAGNPTEEQTEDPGREIPTECASCGVENTPDAKFCKGCGASMAPRAEDPAPPADGEDDDPPPEADGDPMPDTEDDEPPPSSKPRLPGHDARAHGSSLPELLGLSATASLPAQKKRAMDLHAVFAHASTLTGQSNADQIVGGLTGISHDAANAVRYRKERNDLRASADRRERWDLAKRLVATGKDRGEVFADKLKDGRRVAVLTPAFAEMKIGTLRGLVEQREGSEHRRPANPFEPDRATSEAEAANAKASGGDMKARIERAKTDPRVLAMANRPGQTVPLAALAASFVAEGFDLIPTSTGA